MASKLDLVKLDKIIKTKKYGKPNAFVDVDATAFKKHMEKLYKDVDKTANDEKVAQQMAETLIKLSIPFIPFRDEYRIKSTGEDKGEAEDRTPKKIKQRTSIRYDKRYSTKEIQNQEINTTYDEFEKQGIKWAKHTSTEVMTTPKAHRVKKDRFGRPRTHAVTKDGSFSFSADGNYSTVKDTWRDVAWQGRLTNRLTRNIKRYTKDKLLSKSIVQGESMYDIQYPKTKAYVNESTEPKPLSIRINDLYVKGEEPAYSNKYAGNNYKLYQQGKAFIARYSKNAIRGPNNDIVVPVTKLKTKWKLTKSKYGMGVAIPHNVRVKVRNKYKPAKELYYADRPPHLSDVDKTHNIQVMSIKNDTVGRIAIANEKPIDENYYAKGGINYAYTQYYGVDKNGDIIGDRGWRRFTPGTTSRWLEVAAGMKIDNVRGAPKSETAGNRKKLAAIVSKELKRRRSR